MGTGSSIEADGKRQNTTRKSTKKDIREQMLKEFGEVGHEELENNNNVGANESADTNNNNNNQQILVNPTLFKAKRLFMKPIMNSRPKENKLVIKKQVSY